MSVIQIQTFVGASILLVIANYQAPVIYPRLAPVIDTTRFTLTEGLAMSSANSCKELRYYYSLCTKLRTYEGWLLSNYSFYYALYYAFSYILRSILLMVLHSMLCSFAYYAM